MRYAFLIGLILIAPPGLAETDLPPLSAGERAALGAEIRAVLNSSPALLSGLSDQITAPVPQIGYQDEIERDLARLDARKAELFSAAHPGFGPMDAPQEIALFTRKDCPDCERAEAGLRELAEAGNLRVTLIDFDKHAGLAEALGLDMAPSYVLPDMMLRGEMPTIVLKRYLEDGS